MADEDAYSGADVDAFTAALNRDIGGDTSNSQIADSDTGILTHTSNPTSNQLLGQQQTSSHEQSLTHQHQQEEEQHHLPGNEPRLSEQESQSLGSAPDNQNQQTVHSMECDQLQPEPKQTQDDQQHNQPRKNSAQISELTPSQQQEHIKAELDIHHEYSESPQLQKQAQQGSLARNQMTQNRGPFNVSITVLLPMLTSHLDKDKNMQLEQLVNKLKQNEVNKESFLRALRNIVGEQTLRQAAGKIQMEHAQKLQAGAAQNPQTSRHHDQLWSSQQHMMPSSSIQQFNKAQSFPSHHQNQSQRPASSVPMETDACFPTPENSVQKLKELEHHGHTANMKANCQEGDLSIVTPQGVQQQQHQLHLPPTSFPMYGASIGNFSSNPYSGPSVSGSSTSIKTQSQDSQIRKVPHPQGMASSPSGAGHSMNLTNMPNYDAQSMLNDPKRLHGGPISHLTGHTGLQQNPLAWQPAFNKDQRTSSLSSSYPKQETTDPMATQQHKPQLYPPNSSSFETGHVDHVNPVPAPSKDEHNDKQLSKMGFPISSSMIPKNQTSGSMSTQPEAAKMTQTWAYTTQTRAHLRLQLSSTTTPAGTGASVRTPPKKSSLGQKRPLEAPSTSSPLSSKRPKASSGALLDQSIEQLNDVTAVSGVNLKEEEEQLLAAPKEESRASEACRRVVQEEEERLILQKGCLQKKLAEITSKCGIKSIGNDVERCLSLSVEERLRGLIGSMSRLSKQRADGEKSRHRIFITSDVGRQIFIMNQKAKEDWDKRQAEEAEKLRKNNDTDGNAGADVEKEKDKDKDEGRLKPPKLLMKANKDEDDKMRTTAANVAARAAVGGDDMLSKWQLMAEQARLKREGGQDGAAGAVPGKDLGRRLSSVAGKASMDDQDTENKGLSISTTSGVMRKSGRNQGIMSQTKTSHTISVKDVIAVLEREPQMSKSSFMYRLYERELTRTVRHLNDP
ncbi:hypothetical protein ACLOJK_015378 [Asimina triloba]